MKYGMVIDLKRCVGCDACTVACKMKHGLGPGILYRKVIKYEIGEFPNARPAYLPIQCNHCDNPPCVDVCPVGASVKRSDGIVTVDPDKCIGCRYCQVVCPYDARQFITSNTKGYYPEIGLTPFEEAKFSTQQAGIVEKCDFCVDRLSEGKQPLCVEACPAEAMFFGDLDDPNSEVSRILVAENAQPLKPEAGTHPNVFYIGG